MQRTNHNRQHYWILLLSGLFLAGPGLSKSGKVRERPNIVLITVDTFRPDHLGYYGYPHETSSELDRFSREGIFFRQAFTTSGWTAPGLISIHTSLYAPTHGVDVRGKSLDPAVVTLAESLAEVGYRVPDIFFLTDIHNFWHLGFEPYEKRTEYLKLGDEILFKWLIEEAALGEERPFFLYYHYRDLHQPYAPGEQFDALFTPGSYGHVLNPISHLKRFLSADRRALVQREVMLPRGIADFKSWDRDWINALYDGQIRKFDKQFLGRFRRNLQELGFSENTLVVVSADHGEELLDHGMIGHVSTFQEGRLYDEIVRIPLIMWWPSRLPAARIIDEIVQCIDVMPTLLELAGAPTPVGVQGRSLLPLIHGDRDRSTIAWNERPAFFETSEGGYTANSEQYSKRTLALRTPHWKLVSATNRLPILYDLQSDSLETLDVATAYPAVADSLHGILNNWVLKSQVQGMMLATTNAVDLSQGSPITNAESPELAPRVMKPSSGDTLPYLGANQTINLSWTGPSDVPYAVEYVVGEGVYRLEGELLDLDNDPAFGPFHVDFWNSLVLYNPWRFRVYRQDNSELKSDWVTFYLAPAQLAMAEKDKSSVALAGSLVFSQQILLLFRGLANASYDLANWTVGKITVISVLGGIAILACVSLCLYSAGCWLGFQRVFSWFIATLYVLFVYATVPVMRDVWDALDHYTAGSVSYLGIISVFVIIMPLLLCMVYRVRARMSPYLVFAFVSLLYGYILFVYSEYPAERLHLVQYGLMSFLLLRALRLEVSGNGAYLGAFALTAFFGIGDEVIQWILPHRFFQIEDVLLNTISGGLGLLVTRLVFGPEFVGGSLNIPPRIEHDTLRIGEPL